MLGALRPQGISTLAREARSNLRAFRSAYCWLFRELVAFSRRRVLVVVALNVLGVVLQWVVVGAVLIFVGELTREGGAFVVPLLSGIELPVDASAGVVAIWGITVLVLVAAASASAYGAEAIGFETARLYVTQNGRNILARTLGARSLTDESESPSRRLQLLLGRDQLMVMRALTVIQRALRAVLMGCVAGLVLTLINPVLSAVVAAVAILFIIPYYLVNRRMVGAAAALQARSAEAGASISRLVEHATTREPNAETRRVVPELYPIDLSIAERWNVLRDIMLGARRTSALMSGLIGTSLVAVVVTFGLIIARDGTSWVAALTFVIGLNFASGAFMELAGLVTAANRFLPHVQDYIAYSDKLDPGSDSARALPLPTLRAPEAQLPTGEEELSLEPGMRALCVWPTPVDRLNLRLLLERLVDGDAAAARRLREAAFFYGDPASLPPISVATMLGEFGSSALDHLGLRDEVDRLPDGAETILTPEIQEHLSPYLRFALGMIEGAQSDLLVLAWKPFSRLTVDEREALSDVLAKAPVLFLTTAAPVKPPADVTHVIVLGERGVVGMGTSQWYRRVSPDLQAESRPSQPAPAVSGMGLDEVADA